MRTRARRAADAAFVAVFSIGILVGLVIAIATAPKLVGIGLASLTAYGVIYAICYVFAGSDEREGPGK